MSVKRLTSMLTKGNLWLYILAELSKQPMYAYEIAKTLKEKHKIPVVTVTTYVVLYKMKKEGLVMKKGEDSSFKHPGRKYYTITEKGIAALAEGKKILQDTRQYVDELSEKTQA